MSTADSEGPDSGNPPLPKKVYRTVSPGYRGRADYEMGAIGWSIFLILLVLLVPFLPVVIAVWAVSKLFGRAAA